MKRVALSILIGGLILFVWNIISWMGLPFHDSSLHSIPESALNTSILQSSLPEDGVYHYPGMDTENVEAKLSQGPRIPLMVFKKGSTQLFDPASFGVSFAINLLTAASLLLIMARLKDKSLRSLLQVALLLGLAASLVSDFSLMNWYMFPLDYTIINVMDHLIGFTLVAVFFHFFSVEKEKQPELTAVN